MNDSFRSFISLGAVFLIASASSLAYADYLWLQREGAHTKVLIGELRKPLPRLPTLAGAAAVLPESEAAPAYEQTADHLQSR